MNNEIKNRPQHNDELEQELRVQQEWKRLQDEAIAAQRLRLEQEREQAQQQQDSALGETEFFMGIDWCSKPVLAGLVTLGLVVLVLISGYFW